MNLQALTAATLDLAAASILKVNSGGLQKATIDIATGLTGTPLEAPAKLLVPLLSPFRQSIARETVGGNTMAWKKITAVTPTGSFFPAEGVKANLFALTKVDDSATYKSYGRGGDVTWEGEIAGRNFEDVRARAEALLSLQVLKEEELIILGGNVTALSGASAGVGPVVTAAPHAGGSLADDEYFVGITALTMEGAARGSRTNRVYTTTLNRFDLATDGIPTLDHAVGETDTGTEDSGTTATTNNALKLTWAAVSGAVAYGVYVGLTTNVKKLVAIVSQTEMVIDTLPALTGAAEPSTDTTVTALAFNGIIPQLLAAGSGAYTKALNGPLSAPTGVQIPEIASMLSDIYDRTKSEPDRLVMSWDVFDKIDEKLASVSNDRISLQVNVTGDVSGAQLPRFTSIKSPRGKVIPLEENPNIPGGMMLGLIDSVPYPDSAIPAAWKMFMGSDMVRLDYALAKPSAEFEIRAFGALAGYAPALQGIIYDIHQQ